jgi:hypothetical protein
MSNDQQRDRIGVILRDMAARVEREVVAPDPHFITQRSRRQHRRRYQRLAVAAALVVIAGAITASLVLPAGSRSGSVVVASYPVQFEHTRLVVKDLLDVQTNAATIPNANITSLSLPITSANNASIAFGDGDAWVLENTGGSPWPCGQLVAVNAASVTVSGSVPISLCPEAVAYGAGSVWVLASQINVSGYQLIQVDPATLTVRSTTVIDGGDNGITPQGDTGAKYAFVSADGNNIITAFQGASGEGELAVVDASSGAVVASTTVPSADGPVDALSANDAAVWVGTMNGWVLSLNPQSGMLSPGRRLGTRVASLVASNTGLWVTVNLPVPDNAAYPGLDTLRLNPSTGATAEDTGLPTVFIATDGASVWVLSSAAPYSADAGLVASINPTSGAMNEQATLPVESNTVPNTLGVYEGDAWVINDGARTLTRVSP